MAETEDVGRRFGVYPLRLKPSEIINVKHNETLHAKVKEYMESDNLFRLYGYGPRLDPIVFSSYKDGSHTRVYVEWIID